MPNERWPGLAALALASALASGCGIFHRSPPLPPVVIVEPPLLFPTPPPAPADPPYELTPVMPPAPDWKLVLDVAPPPRLPHREPRTQPAPQRPAHETDKPQPQLNAGLSPQEQFAYRDQVQATLARAQRDLQILARRSLPATAAATRAQAGEYVHQAQQALKLGDLVRAQMLAAKAETLARFLLGQ